MTLLLKLTLQNTILYSSCTQEPGPTIWKHSSLYTVKGELFIDISWLAMNQSALGLAGSKVCCDSQWMWLLKSLLVRCAIIRLLLVAVTAIPYMLLQYPFGDQ